MVTLRPPKRLSIPPGERHSRPLTGWLLAGLILLTACASAPPRPGVVPGVSHSPYGHEAPAHPNQSFAGHPDLVMQALAYLDVNYQRGGHSAATGFDCSGFVQHLYQDRLGVSLPRVAADQARATRRITRDALAPGDLVFFNTLRRPYSHVGMYLGGGRFIHAPRTGAQVRVEQLSTRYWAQRFNGAHRVDAAMVAQGPR